MCEYASVNNLYQTQDEIVVNDRDVSHLTNDKEESDILIKVTVLTNRPFLQQQMALHQFCTVCVTIVMSAGCNKLLR